MIYLDTSAFLKLYLREDGSELVQRAVESQDQPIPISQVLLWEFVNALRLRVFRGELGAPTVEHLIALYDDRLLRGQYVFTEIDHDRLTTNVRELSVHTQMTGTPTMSLVHVAVAFQLQVDAFFTFDDRQRLLAESVGLSIGGNT